MEYDDKICHLKLYVRMCVCAFLVRIEKKNTYICVVDTSYEYPQPIRRQAQKIEVVEKKAKRTFEDGQSSSKGRSVVVSRKYVVECCTNER